jgi:tetratricopeptide (TPR) repeat protein
MLVMVPVCLAFTGLTIARNSEWKDNYTLFKTDLEKAPNDSRLNFYLGDELAENIYPTEKDPAKQKEILKESIRLLNRSLAIFPEFTDAHTEAGKAHFLALDYDSAIYHYRTAISQSPYQSIAANNLGTVYLRLGKLRDALDAYQLAIKINPGFVQAFYNLGCTYVQTKQLDSAVLNLNKTLALAPGYLDAYMQMGMAYFQEKKWDQAEPLFKKVLELNPNEVNAMNNLGAVYLNSGKVPQAVEIFKKVIAVNPSYINGYSNLGHCYYDLKQYQACIDVINKALQLDPKDVKDIPYLALSYKGLGNMPEALKYEAIAKQYYSNFRLE